MHGDQSITRRASSFGAQAAAYDLHRPDYPSSAVEWALRPVSAEQTPRVLDLGAGTGKLTAVIAATGASVTAVEPDDAMRAELVRGLPSVRALSGTAERIPLPDASVDAVLVGQAYHWFDQERALPEISRVLRPGGVLAALWNDDDRRVDWVAEFNAIYHGSARSTLDSELSLGQLHYGSFSAEEAAEFAHSQVRTAQSLVATIATHSLILVMAEEQRAALTSRLLEYLLSRPETSSGEFELPIRTVAIRTTRT